MFGEGLDRESIVTRIVGAVCALAALGGIGMIIAGAGFTMLIVSLSNAAIAILCFTEQEREKEIFIGAVGAVILAELLGIIFTSYRSSTTVINAVTSMVLHAAIILYFLGTIDRNKAMGAGAIIAVDNAWRICTFIRIMSFIDNSLMGGIIDKSEAVLLALGSVVCVVPALAITVLLFTGVLDYGN